MQTSALGDYTAPIHQLVPVLQKQLLDIVNTGNQAWDCVSLGNALLIYASCCLQGRQFPRKNELPEGLHRKVKADVLRALLSQHSSLASDSERQYPYLRTLLRYKIMNNFDILKIICKFLYLIINYFWLDPRNQRLPQFVSRKKIHS